MNFIDLCRKTPVVINILRLKTDTIYKPIEMKAEQIKSNEWLLLWDLK